MATIYLTLASSNAGSVPLMLDRARLPTNARLSRRQRRGYWQSVRCHSRRRPRDSSRDTGVLFSLSLLLSWELVAASAALCLENVCGTNRIGEHGTKLVARWRVMGDRISLLVLPCGHLYLADAMLTQSGHGGFPPCTTTECPSSEEPCGARSCVVRPRTATCYVDGIRAC